MYDCRMIVEVAPPEGEPVELSVMTTDPSAWERPEVPEELAVEVRAAIPGSWEKEDAYSPWVVR